MFALLFFFFTERPEDGLDPWTVGPLDWLNLLSRCNRKKKTKTSKQNKHLTFPRTQLSNIKTKKNNIKLNKKKKISQTLVWSPFPLLFLSFPIVLDRNQLCPNLSYFPKKTTTTSVDQIVVKGDFDPIISDLLQHP